MTEERNWRTPAAKGVVIEEISRQLEHTVTVGPGWVLNRMEEDTTSSVIAEDGRDDCQLSFSRSEVLEWVMLSGVVVNSGEEFVEEWTGTKTGENEGQPEERSRSNGTTRTGQKREDEVFFCVYGLTKTPNDGGLTDG